jgi:hypothetical protein
MTFKSLEVSDYETLKHYFSGQPYNLSIYSLASLIAWSSQNFKTSFNLLNGVCFMANEKEHAGESRHLILPVSGQRTFKPSELHQHARELGYKRYSFVPGDYIERFDRMEWDNFFTLTEQNEFEDYVYRTEDLVELKGNRYSKKRNLISQFKRNYLFYNRVSVESIRPAAVEECERFLEIWCEEHACSEEEQNSLACEKSALVKTLHHLDRLESMSIMIRIDGVVSALGIGSRLNETTATLNFEKAFVAIKGLYQFLDNECAIRLFSAYRFINKESDMNLPDLAEAKKSYDPVYRVKSFELVVR